ncbi:MAG: glucose 1-dehydrogenase [Acidobacteria bacterium]|nr:glucose 1-dehydrogenase [Acidobacteriota bacterium]MBS1866325.1 glucose 1-dehydrogenase [Acidobacteriota bacterium]
MNNPEKRLAGRTAVVTGGAQGIGRAIAERFQCEGARVFIVDCDLAAGESTAAELTGRAAHLPPVTFLHADLSRPQEILEIMNVIPRHSSALHILVNNGGIEIDKPFEQTSLADWESIMNVNLRGAFLMTQAALPLFPAQGGVILNISSIHATHAFPNAAAYACSKAALVALTRNLALELAPRLIRVNSISPGYIDTRLWEDFLRYVPNAAAVAKQTAALHPLGRRGVPADIAEAAFFLASDASSFMTGTNVVVDGGITIRAHAPIG